MFTSYDRQWAHTQGVNLDEEPPVEAGSHDGCVKKWAEERAARERAEACARSAWDETEKAQNATEAAVHRADIWRTIAVVASVLMVIFAVRVIFFRP